jgi:iron complex outermembrane receptor protein
LQREVNVASASSGLAQSIFNTADARIWGGEVEARLVAGNTTLSANAGYVHARYSDVRFDISGDGAVSPADALLRLPRVPPWTFGGEVKHSIPLRSGSSVVARASYQYRDAYAWTDSNFGWVSDSENLDADISWTLPGRNVRLSLFGRNLLDEVQFGGDTQLGFAGGPLSDGNNRPFDPRPAAGTFSPLARGRFVGAEIAVSY